MLFFVVLVGVGVRGGTIYGEIDCDVGYLIEKPVLFEDLVAIIYDVLGIDLAL